MTGIAHPQGTVAVGVVVERRKASSPWIDFTWRPVQLLLGIPDAPAWTALSAEKDGVATFYAGAADIELFRTESSNYQENLHAAAPSIWVALRPTGLEPPFDLAAVTADPAEGESYTQAGSDLVGAVPMPPALRDAIEAFIEAYPVRQVRHKRRRDDDRARQDPER